MSNLALEGNAMNDRKRAMPANFESGEKKARQGILEVLSTYGHLVDPEGGDTEVLAERRKNFIHDTQKALESYRGAIQMLTTTPDEIVDKLNAPLDKIGALIDSVDTVGGGVRTGYTQERCNNDKRMIEKIRYINYCMGKLKAFQINQYGAGRKGRQTGENYYQALYLTYIDPRYLTVDEIITELDVSKNTYYRWREDGLETLSDIMWGSSSPIITRLIDLFGCIIEDDDE